MPETPETFVTVNGLVHDAETHHPIAAWHEGRIEPLPPPPAKTEKPPAKKPKDQT